MGTLKSMIYSVFTVFFGALLIFIDSEQASWPDKGQHWQRVLQIAQGHLLAVPDPNGSGVYGGIFDGKFYAFNNTAINSVDNAANSAGMLPNDGAVQ